MRYFVVLWIINFALAANSPAGVLYQGKIVDRLSDEPLSHVHVRGWYGGRYDDGFSLKDGSFRLDLPVAADSIVISSLGYRRIRLVNPVAGHVRMIGLEIEPFLFPAVEILAGSDPDQTKRLPLSAAMMTQADLKTMAGMSLSQKLSRLGYYIRDYGGEGGVKAMVVRGN
ncbi:MAG: hypothetical protein KBA26_13460, partial [Candidatus Delongbacteria bacterium]|nr:hypothetical protein [Candidatus Delongbacteria bacterium]